MFVKIINKFYENCKILTKFCENFELILKRFKKILRNFMQTSKKLYKQLQ